MSLSLKDVHKMFEDPKLSGNVEEVLYEKIKTKINNKIIDGYGKKYNTDKRGDITMKVHAAPEIREIGNLEDGRSQIFIAFLKKDYDEWNIDISKHGYFNMKLDKQRLREKNINLLLDENKTNLIQAIENKKI